MSRASEVLTFKVLVAGLDNAGKTTFIKSIAEIDVISADPVSSTSDGVADFGRIMIDDNIILYLMSIPEKSPQLDSDVETYWSILKEDMLGLIILVDSTAPELFKKVALKTIFFELNSPAPYLIVANKQEKIGAWDLDALRFALRVPSTVPIIPCVAHDRKSVANVLITLLQTIQL